MTSKCRTKHVAFVSSSRQYNEIFHYYSYSKERLSVFDNAEFSPITHVVNNSICGPSLQHKGSHWLQNLSTRHTIGPTAWHLCRAVVCKLWNLGHRGPSPRSLPACRTNFIAFYLKCSIMGMLTYFFHLLRMSLDSCAFPTIRRICDIFWHGGISYKSQIVVRGGNLNPKASKFDELLSNGNSTPLTSVSPSSQRPAADVRSNQ